jgi:hypothetical protein
MTNFDQLDSVDRYQRVLDRSGISNELEQQGVEPGDIVRIAGVELTWGEEFELSNVPSRRTAKERRFGPETGEDEIEQERADLFDLDEDDYEPEEVEETDDEEIDFDDYELADADEEDDE